MGLKDRMCTSYLNDARGKPQHRNDHKTPVEIWRRFWYSRPLEKKSAVNTEMFFPLPGPALPGVISWALLGGD